MGIRKFTIRDIERMENEQEKLNGRNSLESFYNIPFKSHYNQPSVKTQNSWKREFLIPLSIGLLLLFITVILHAFGLL